MKAVPDAFLLEVAGIAASLLGFFVIGVFFYVQRGMFPQAAAEAQRYMRAATRSVILLYGMVLLLALALVVVAERWVSLLYLGLSLLLFWSMVRMSMAIKELHRALDVRLMSQFGMWAAAVAVLAFPWVLGGMQPDRTHLTWAVFLVGVAAFASSASLVLSAFDISGMEASVPPPEKRADPEHDVATASTLAPAVEPDADRAAVGVGDGRR